LIPAIDTSRPKKILSVKGDKLKARCDRLPDHDSSLKNEGRIMRYELTDHEWAAIKPMLPNKPRGVPRVSDRRGLKGSHRRILVTEGIRRQRVELAI
jgi:hypothetical protein